MSAYAAVLFEWEGVLALPNARGALEAAIREALEACGAPKAFDAVREASAAGVAPAAALREVARGRAPEAEAAFDAALADVWDVGGPARALLHSLRYRGYRLGVASGLATSADGLGRWMAGAGLPAYADEVFTGAEHAVPSATWPAARSLAVVGDAGRWDAWAAAGVRVIPFPSAALRELVSLGTVLGEGVAG
ncbi:MAG: hypothetical protein ACKVVT_14995 [Dehalococcoidia bacterium]